MEKKYVFMMLGYLGSGKSFVSRWMAPHIGAVHLRVDDLRLAMFGIDKPGLYTPENKALVNNASHYALQQILKSGRAHIVQDANHNAKSVRSDIAKKVAEHGGVAVVIWVQTPLEVAKERTEIRKETEGHELFEPNLVEKMAKLLEEPDQQHELVITIDGQASAPDQQKSFDEQWSAIKNNLEENVQYVHG
jgi:predicted kinase